MKKLNLIAAICVPIIALELVALWRLNPPTIMAETVEAAQLEREEEKPFVLILDASVYGSDTPTPEPETEAPETEPEVQEIPLGSFKLTAYCGCTKCCGKNAKKGPDGEWLAITRSGVRAQKNHTIAVDPKVIPLGSKVRIGDIIYTAEDTGGKWVQGNHIDIFFGDHEKARQFGCQRADVYLIKEDKQ